MGSSPTEEAGTLETALNLEETCVWPNTGRHWEVRKQRDVQWLRRGSSWNTVGRFQCLWIPVPSGADPSLMVLWWSGWTTPGKNRADSTQVLTTLATHLACLWTRSHKRAFSNSTFPRKWQVAPNQEVIEEAGFWNPVVLRGPFLFFLPGVCLSYPWQRAMDIAGAPSQNFIVLHRFGITKLQFSSLL